MPQLLVYMGGAGLMLIGSFFILVGLAGGFFGPEIAAWGAMFFVFGAVGVVLARIFLPSICVACGCADPQCCNVYKC